MMGFVKAIYNLLINTGSLVYGVFPTSADGVAAVAVQLASAAVAWTWGAWTQVVLAAGVTANVQVWGISLENFVGALAQGEVAIGIGTAPAGTEIARIPITAPITYLKDPVRVVAGNGLVARYRTSTGAADNVSVKLLTRTGFGA